MTKQPHSATKLRLSKLFRWLALLCFMKLTILGLLLLDIPLPSWLGGPSPEQRTAQTQPANAPRQTAASKASQMADQNTAQNIAQDTGPTTASGAPDTAPAETSAGSSMVRAVDKTLSTVGSALDAALDATLSKTDDARQAEPRAPQGSAAARMAAQAMPAGQGKEAADAALPAPLIHAGTPTGASSPASSPAPSSTAAAPSRAAAQAQQPQAFSPNLPEPQPLPAPRAQPGTPAPSSSLLASAAPHRATESEWLDALGLSSLPIPGLGSVQAAHAAALDMPVPQTPAESQSPFTPAAQSAPTSVPGAPPIPANIPRGQSADGAPLPPRGAANTGNGYLPPLPQGQTSSLPTPAVQPAPNSYANDPNAKAQELARQQQDILVLRQQMDQRLKDIQTTEKRMQDMIREARGIENEKIHRLVLTYAMMKPKAAARALESMDERVAIRILSGMSPKQSGEVLSYMQPAKTAKLTELITRMRIPE